MSDGSDRLAKTLREEVTLGCQYLAACSIQALDMFEDKEYGERSKPLGVAVNVLPLPTNLVPHSLPGYLHSPPHDRDHTRSPDPMQAVF